MRHSATRALLERDDVIIVALGVVHLRHRRGRDLFAMTFQLKLGERIDRASCCADLVDLQYKRNDQRFPRAFRVRGDTVESSRASRGPRLAAVAVRRRDGSITEFDPLTGQKTAELEQSRSTPTRTMSRPSRRCTRPSSASSMSLKPRCTNCTPRPRAGGPAAGTAHPFDLEMMRRPVAAPASRTIRAT